MSYKQLRPFDQLKAGKVHGECLKNTRLGFGIARKYDSAWQAWLNTEQHSGLPPAGLDVLCFFSFRGADNGHVGVRLTNGQFWSDGIVYPNIAAYQASHEPRYVGWGESLNEVRVLQYVAPTAPPTPAGGTLHLDKGTTTTTFNSQGQVVGHIYAKDDSYNYVIRARSGNKVQINSASGGGNGVWVAITYLAGGAIPGRHIK